MLERYKSQLIIELKNRKPIVLEIISYIARSKPFVEHLVESNPILGAEIGQNKFKDSDEFNDFFISRMMKNTNSPLCSEINSNHNISGNNIRLIRLDNSNQVLNFYLEDPKVARNIEIWRPIGETIISNIKENVRKDCFYNSKFDGSTTPHKNIISLGIHFFYIMQSRSIEVRDKDMYLEYYRYFIKDILFSLNRADDTDISREFPSNYDYYLFEIIHNLQNLALSIIDIEEKPSLEHLKKFPEYSCGRVYAISIRDILLSEKIPEPTKTEYFEGITNSIIELEKNELYEYISNILDNLFVRTYCKTGNKKIKEVLYFISIYKKMDHTIRFNDKIILKKLKDMIKYEIIK